MKASPHTPFVMKVILVTLAQTKHRIL